MENPETKPRDKPSIPHGYAVAAIVLFLMPFAGVLARLWTARLYVLTAAGLGLWLVTVVTFVLIFRRIALNAGIPFSQHLVAWTVEFAALYFLSVAVTGAILSR
jgi:hypothetical protein